MQAVLVATATRRGCGGWGKADLEIKGNLGETKGECNLDVEVLGNGKGDLEVKQVDGHKGKGRMSSRLRTA